MLHRTVLSSALTFALGIGGGMVANRVMPPSTDLSLSAKPAQALRSL